MNPWNLIIRSLAFYRWKNLPVILGISVSTAVLTGSFIVGDSVSHNLQNIVNLRLGRVNYTLTTGERYVTSSLVAKMRDEAGVIAAPVLLSEGVAVAGGGDKRVNKVQVIGVDEYFDNLMGTESLYSDLTGNEVIISHNLAQRLDVKAGDNILVRIRKSSLIPLNAPFISDDNFIITSRLLVKVVAGDSQAARFNPGISQTSPYNVFLSIDFLNGLMNMDNKVNLILFADKGVTGTEEILSLVKSKWSLADAGLKLREIKESNELEIISERVFFDDPVIKALKSLPVNPEFILTYFVNSLSVQSSESQSYKEPAKLTPYSFVSTLPDNVISDNDIIINKWLAQDLGLKTGDQINLKYYIVGPLRKLSEAEKEFTVKDIVTFSGRYADKNLMPEIPGLSDAGNCRDWDTGIPIDLDKIRDKDERYWSDYKGTPKAFVSVSIAKDLWENIYGSYTSARFPAGLISPDTVSVHLTRLIDPFSFGFQVSAVRKDGIHAAANAVDFSQLFFGLSVFVVIAAIILTVLLLILNLEGRHEQVTIMSALGIPGKTIGRIMLTEGLILTVTGTLTGLVFSVFYTRIIFKALNGVWMDIVRTDMMHMILTIKALIFGFIFSVLIAGITMHVTIRKFLLKKRTKNRTILLLYSQPYILYIAIISLTIAVILIISQLLSGEVVNSSIFFIAGGLMLLSLLLWTYYLLNITGTGKFNGMTIPLLSIKNLVRNKTRSISIISVLSIGTFIVLSTGANRKDVFSEASDKKSGTGGFLFFSESTVPVLRDLNQTDVRQEFGLTGDYRFVQFSVAPGDDASCLNLNRISNPKILGVNPEKLKDRFSFISLTPFINSESPWMSIKSDLQGEVIPAFADQTVIKWGLGMKTGDTLYYTDYSGKMLPVVLAGGIANSVFQGYILIAEEYFEKYFPDYIGSRIFLIEAEKENLESIQSELEFIFRDYGWDMTLAAERLAAFNSVENTYLSIFLLMGVLAILIGTVGLSIVLAKSLLERRKEIGIMKALGISRKKILNLFMNEYILLLTAGILIGVFASSISISPSLLKPESGVSFFSVLFVAGVLFIHGVLWIWIMAKHLLKERVIISALREE